MSTLLITLPFKSDIHASIRPSIHLIFYRFATFQSLTNSSIQSDECCESQYFPFNRPLRNDWVSYSMMKTFIKWKAAIVVVVDVVQLYEFPTFSSILFLPLCSRSSASGQWRGTVWPPPRRKAGLYVLLLWHRKVKPSTSLFILSSQTASLFLPS